MTDQLTACYARVVAWLHNAQHTQRTQHARRDRDERGSLSLEQSLVAAGLATLGLAVVGAIGVAAVKYFSKL